MNRVFALGSSRLLQVEEDEELLSRAAVPLAFPPAVYEGSTSCTPSPTPVVWTAAILLGALRCLTAVRICISLIVTDGEHLFKCGLALYVLPLEKGVVPSYAYSYLFILFTYSLT